MAIEKEILIKVNTSDAVDSMEKLSGSVKKQEGFFAKFTTSVSGFLKIVLPTYAAAKNEIEATGKAAGKAAEKTSDGMSALGKTANVVKGGFKGIGTAIKAMGMGILVMIVAKLSDVFKGNQKVTDALNIAFTAFSIVVSKIVETFVEMFGEVSKSTGGFDAIRKVVSGGLTIAINGLLIAVYGVIYGVKTVQKAWEESFLGDGDPKKIKALTDEITSLGAKISTASDGIKKGGKEIANNFIEAVGEVGSLGVGVLKATEKSLKEIDVSTAVANAKTMERNKKNFELLALEQARLQLKYQTDAEKLRQIRDDDQISISKRITANNELSEVLKKQFQAESGTIKQRIAGLQSEQKLLGKKVERSNEIYQLQTDLIDVGERLAGQESEQLTNKNSLLKESIDLKNSALDTDLIIHEKKKDFEASIQEDELLKLEMQKINLEESLLIAQEELDRKKELYQQDTQNRVDAENAFKLKKQEIDIALKTNAKAQSAESKKRADADSAEAKKRADAEKQLDRDVQNAKLDIAENTAGLLGMLAEEGSDLAKGLAITQATISGIQGVQNAFTTANASPITSVFPAYPFIQAGLAGAFSAIQIAKIASADSGGGGGGQQQAPTTTAPSFNLVQGSESSQIADSINKKSDMPIKAYMTVGDVNSNQQLNANIKKNAKL